MSRNRMLAALLALVALVVNACGGSSAPSEESGADEEVAVEDAESPIAAAIGFDINSPDSISDMQRDIERKTQECMRSQGFEYELAATGSTDAFADRSTMSEEDYAATHGYGVPASFLSFADRGGAGNDPNKEMLDAMSDGERQAWETALTGASSAESGSAGFLPGGCRGEASQDSMSGIMAMQQLGPQIQEMRAEMVADPRMVEISQRWSACMAEKGYEFSDNTEAFESVNQSLTQVMASLNPASPEITAEQREQLEAVKQEEIEVASADYACIKPDRDEAQAIRREYELRFVEENQATFEGLGS